MPVIAVLIPCYNEALTIQKVVNDFREQLPEADIYVFDNNSTDDTIKIAQEAGAIVHKVSRQGKGNVIREMFRIIQADCYVMADGDDTYPASFVRSLIDPVLENQADMVIGDRLSSNYFHVNRRMFHNAGNKLVRSLINFLWKSDVRDIMTGYRAFSDRFVKLFPVMSPGFEVETEMTIHALDKRFSILEVPIEYQDRPEGSESKLNTYKDGFKVLKTISLLFKDYKPLSFFSVFALILLLLSSGLMIPIIIEYFETGLVPRFPTLIVAGFIAMMAIISFFTGLILDGMIRKSRKEFELSLVRYHSLKNLHQ